jgi:Flp pilus assembly protein TadG
MRFQSDRGAVLIHVAISLIVLLSFTAIVVDQGVMYVARRQAQNAADAGAHGGAVSLMNNMTDYTGATAAAQHFAGQQNIVWGQQTSTANIVVSPLPFACPGWVGGGNACIRVDVMRGQPDASGTGHTNTIRTYMASLFGVNQQGVRATATAQVGAGNLVSCIKPWVVVDKWVDNFHGGLNPNAWDMDDVFHPGIDTYVKPGFRADTDTGMQLMLKGDGHEWGAGWSMRIELGGGNGSSTYVDEIQGCPSWVKPIGLYDGTSPCESRSNLQYEEKGCIGVRPGVSQGPTVKHGVDELIALDSTAKWDTGLNKVVGGCTQSGTCAQVNPLGMDVSPRIIALALFDPQACFETSCQTGNNTVAEVVNIFGFFLEGTCDEVFATPPAWCGQPDKTVVGRMMPYPGSSSGAAGSAGPETFLKIVRLVQ